MKQWRDNGRDVILTLFLDKIKANYYGNIISLCLLLPNNSPVWNVIFLTYFLNLP